MNEYELRLNKTWVRVPPTPLSNFLKNMQLSLTTLEILLIIGFVFSCVMIIYNTYRIKTLEELNRYQKSFINDVKLDFRKSEKDLYEHVRLLTNDLNDLIRKRFKDLKKDKQKKENQK